MIEKNFKGEGMSDKEKIIFKEEIMCFLREYPEEVINIFKCIMNVLYEQIAEFKEMSMDMECAANFALWATGKKSEEFKEMAKNKMRPWHGKSFTNLDWLFKEDC